MLGGEEHGVKGDRVEEAKPKVRQAMLDAGLAAKYWEPEAEVVSRSGDECVVAFLDQWFLKYGDPEWQNSVVDHISNPDTFNAFTTQTLEAF